MKPGSVIVDLASEAGGNCEYTVANKVEKTRSGVTIIGYTDLPSRCAGRRSRLGSAGGGAWGGQPTRQPAGRPALPAASPDGHQGTGGSLLPGEGWASSPRETRAQLAGRRVTRCTHS
jgi:hypothetical protein